MKIWKIIVTPFPKVLDTLYVIYNIYFSYRVSDNLLLGGYVYQMGLKMAGERGARDL